MEYAKLRERNEKGQFVVPSAPSGFDLKRYRKEYYIKNRARLIARTVEWGKKNKEQRKLAKDKWRVNNKERVNFLKRRYLYRNKNAEGTHSIQEIRQLYKKFPYCIYCQTRKSDTIDHMTPLSRGGTNDMTNLVPACVSCNSSKGNKTLQKWRPMIWLQFDYLARTRKHYA